MTIREYISQKLNAFGTISEAQLLDMSLSGKFSLEDEYNEGNVRSVGIAMAGGIEELVLVPKMKSVSESGFSVSWDYDGLGKYYLWLCRKWGVTPNEEVVGMLGISMVIDRTNCW